MRELHKGCCSITCDGVTVVVREQRRENAHTGPSEPYLLHSHAIEIHHPNSTVAIGMVLDMWVRERQCEQRVSPLVLHHKRSLSPDPLPF